MPGWAGAGIIVGVQVAKFIYTLRRMDAMQIELRDSRSEIRERLGRLEGVLICRQELGDSDISQ